MAVVKKEDVWWFILTIVQVVSLFLVFWHLTETWGWRR